MPCVGIALCEWSVNYTLRSFLRHPKVHGTHGTHRYNKMLEQSRADWEKRFASTAASVARSKEIEDQRRAQVPHRTTG